MMHIPDDMKEEIRKKIAEGMESLRRGEGTDGEAFFAQMFAELDEEIRAEDERAARERGEK